MILTCNECGAGFNFDENLLKETGSKVRCTKCKNVFTAYPPSSASQPKKIDSAMENEQPVAPGTEPSQEASIDEGIELKNIDLAEIEGILGMDNEPEAGGVSTKGSGELDLDFTTEEDKSPEETLALDLSDMENILEVEDEASEESESSQEEDPGFDLGLDFDTGKNKNEGEGALESTLELEKTEELDLSDLDNVLEVEDEASEESEGKGALESTLESEKTEELDLSDLDNVLEVEDEAGEISESSQEENFDLQLDFGSDKEEVVNDSKPVVESEKAEELDISDFENILEEGEEQEDKNVSTGEDSGLDLDFDIDESSEEDESNFELDETAALDLPDMENILEIEDESSKESELSQEENFDLQLDFGSDKEEVVSDSEPVAESEKTEELDISDFENIHRKTKMYQQEKIVGLILILILMRALIKAGLISNWKKPLSWICLIWTMFLKLKMRNPKILNQMQMKILTSNWILTLKINRTIKHRKALLQRLKCRMTLILNWIWT
jgi:predicted Zn finger-like uncharacterized protein